MRDSIDYIYKELAEKHNLPIKHIEQLEKDWWKSVREEMSSKSGRRILFPNFGSIYIDVKTAHAKLNVNKKYLIDLDAKWKSGGIPWMQYLRKHLNYTRNVVQCQTIIDNMRKRVNRKKGERGL